MLNITNYQNESKSGVEQDK